MKVKEAKTLMDTINENSKGLIQIEIVPEDGVIRLDEDFTQKLKVENAIPCSVKIEMEDGKGNTVEVKHTTFGDIDTVTLTMNNSITMELSSMDLLKLEDFINLIT